MPRGRRALARQESRHAPVSDGVSVNRATLEDLVAVPGIGAAMAAQIVAGRPWARLEDLTTIRGVSLARILRWADEQGLRP